MRLDSLGVINHPDQVGLVVSIGGTQHATDLVQVLFERLQLISWQRLIDVQYDIGLEESTFTERYLRRPSKEVR